MLIFGGITGVTHERNDLLMYNFDLRSWSLIWQNYTEKKEINDLISNSKLILSKKLSMNPREKTAEKRKTIRQMKEKKVAITFRKYRRPLR